MNNELKFLKYLDNAVEYEKGKHRAILKTCPPFSCDKIVEASRIYDEQALSTASDCVNKMIGNRVLRNVSLRRLYEMLVRENFDQLNFSHLSQIPQFQQIKKKVLNNDPELMPVDNSAFLKQIANAIAHGNYVKLLDIDSLETLWTGTDKDFSLDSLKNSPATLNLQKIFGKKSQQYSAEVNSTIDKVNSHTQSVKVTPFEMFQQTLENGMSPAEFVEIKYESNYTVDQNGNRVKRPSTKIYNLKLSLKELDELSAFILPTTDPSKRVIPVDKPGITPKPLNKNNTPIQDALKFLSSSDMVLYDYATQSQEIVELDAHQRKFFINEYAANRELFPPSYYKPHFNNYMADVLSTNATTQYFGLSQLLANSKMSKISSTTFVLSNTPQAYFAFVNSALSNPKNKTQMELVDEYQKKNYYLKQIFDVYPECLISETLLLLQILEDNQQLSSLQNNPTINSIISKFSAKDLKAMQAASKYSDDSLTVIHHLRNSFTHLTYLNNPNGDLYIYDQTSKRNKTPLYKFTINIKSLEKVKDELFTKVSTMYSSSTNIPTQ